MFKAWNCVYCVSRIFASGKSFFNPCMHYIVDGIMRRKVVFQPVHAIYSGVEIKGSLNLPHSELNDLNLLPNYSGIHSQVLLWITLLRVYSIILRVDSTILCLDLHSKLNWSLIWLLKEWIFTPAYLESKVCAWT